MVRGAHAKERLARLKMRTYRGHLILRRKTAAGEEHEQIRLPQCFNESIEVMQLRLVAFNDFHLMPQRLELLFGEVTHSPRSLVVVWIFNDHDHDVGSRCCGNEAKE